MESVISELVNYVSTLFMCMYVFNAYRILKRTDEEKVSVILKQMKQLSFIIISINFLAISINGTGEKAFIIYIAYGIIMAVTEKAYLKLYPGMSGHVLTNMYLLIGIGNVLITRLSFDTALRQLVFEMTGLFAGLVLPKLTGKIKGGRITGLLCYISGIAILAAVYIKGTEVYGAKNWITIGQVMLQPSEFVKILFVAGAAGLLAKIRSNTAIICVSLLAAVHVLILVMSKDLGGALLYYMVYLGMLYCATGRIVYTGAGIICGAAAAVFAYNVFSHVQVRVEAFLNPFELYTGKGYQLSQSLFSICSGGWFGMGLGNGNPDEVPVVKSDFVFSAAAEEFGGITAVCILLICLNLFVMFMSLSARIKRLFLKLSAMGISLLYMFQVFLNVAGVIKLIPSTGITLPFISSGGSSIISSIFMFALIQGMYVENAVAPDEEQEKKAILFKKKRKESLNVKYTKQLNRIIIKFLYTGSSVILVTVLYFTWILSFRAGEINKKRYNTRTAAKRNEIARGIIYSADGEILAFTADEERMYPFGSIFSHTVGRSSYGLSGIERLCNDYLSECSIDEGMKRMYKINDLKLPGNNVITTLDVKLTRAAYDALGDYDGAVVVLDAKTGAVLAMVSKPDYNPQTIAEDYDELTTGEYNAPLLNRAVSGLYSPGSTFKILTTLEYMRENSDYEEFVYECDGSERQHNVTVHCASGKAHGIQNLTECFANSCNSSYSYMGAGLDYDSFYALCSSFLFNNTIRGDFAGTSGKFFLNSAAAIEDISQTVIGAGKTLVTPLQNAVITLSVANGGKIMQPYVVERVENVLGQTVMEQRPAILGIVMSEEEAAYIAALMRSVVTEGTAYSLNLLDVSVAGKTGTAEYDNKGNSHAWFVGFAPFEEPEIVVSIILEGAGSGSRYAVPAAAKIFEEYFR